MVKSSPLKFALPILAMLGLPFVYNSCQGGLLKAGGFRSAVATQCKVGLYKGNLTKLSDQAPASPFATKKVQLSSEGPLQSQTKATDVVVKAGDSLGVILDNSCLQQNPESTASTVITKSALAADDTLMDLQKQVYLWRLERDYTESEIEFIAEKENCLAGISWNQTYKFQSFNDTGLSYQSYLPVIRAEQSYERFYNDMGGMNRMTSKPVMIAVVDTGVDLTHPDLSANLWQHAYGIGIDITTLGGTVNYRPQDASDIGHGTHVSGMIAAVADNNLGIAGAMPFRAQIMPIKLFVKNGQTGELTTTSQYFFNAVRFAHQNGAKVINLSLGNITAGPNSDALAESAINEAIGAGATVVTVTGNAENGNGSEVNGTTLTVIPGIYATRPGVIAVGSIDASTGLKSFFSHYSTTYGEIAAPGAEQGTTGLYSTIPSGSYGRLAGTSQAAPLVSAAAGLAIGLIREARGVFPTPAEVERLILSSAAKDSRLQPYFKDGNRLDLLNLVQKINAEYPESNSGSMDLSSFDCPQ